MNEDERRIFGQLESPSLTNQRPLTSLVFNSRLSPFDLATLVKYFEEKETTLNGPGGVIRLACETLAWLVAKKHPEFVFNSGSEAIQFLTEQGMIKGKGGQNSKRASRFMAFENLLEEEQLENGTLQPVDEVLEMKRFVVRELLKNDEEVSAEQLEMAKLILLPNGTLKEVN